MDPRRQAGPARGRGHQPMGQRPVEKGDVTAEVEATRYLVNGIQHPMVVERARVLNHNDGMRRHPGQRQGGGHQQQRREEVPMPCQPGPWLPGRARRRRRAALAHRVIEFEHTWLDSIAAHCLRSPRLARHNPRSLRSPTAVVDWKPARNGFPIATFHGHALNSFDQERFSRQSLDRTLRFTGRVRRALPAALLFRGDQTRYPFTLFVQPRE